ncbi:MAG: 3-hydroxybutyrate dehydrogenase [Polyangiaceae bacterium]
MLHGKTALVTGSTSGIGLAIAMALAEKGASVVLNGFGNPEGPIGEVSRFAKAGARVGFHGADLRREDEIAAMMAYTEAELGGVDILVNNAGIQHVAPIESFPVDKWNDILAVNLTAAFHTTRLALPHMKKRGWGRIVNVASVHGLVASAEKSAYVAAKHGIVGLTKVTALENARTNVTCNALCPGWVMTPLVEAQIKARAERDGLDYAEAKRLLISEKQPSGEPVTAAQLAEIVLFFASDAGAQVRGVAWTMDGGWTAQ